MRTDDEGRGGLPAAATAAPERPARRPADGPVARVERGDLAAIELRGADVLRYLHTVTSQHLAERRPPEAAGALLLSPKGKIEFAFRVAVLPDRDGAVRVVVDTEAEAAEALAERLARFVFRYDVRVGEPVPGGLTLLGAASGEAAESAGLPVPADTDHAAEHRADNPDDGSADDSWLVVHRTALGLDLVGPGVAGAASAPALLGVPAAGAGDLEALRIEAGIPRWGRELTDDVIAEEAGLLGSHVHLDKGCYPGQETVARVHNLGQVPRRLAGLLVEGTAPPPFRADLTTGDGRRAGQARSAAVHPALGPIALAYVRRTVAPGERVHAAGAAATVVDLPFRPVPGDRS